MIDVDQTLESQYANSFSLKSLIESLNDAIDPRTDFDNFYNFVWNVETAQGFGLDIWGRIVGVNRTINIPSPQNFFGFNSADNSWQPFNQAPFFDRSAGFIPSTTFVLPDSAYRTLILVKAASNISNCSAPSINKLLQALFPGRGTAYVADPGGMRMEYRFFFPLSAVEQAIVLNSGVMPKSAGVQLSLVIIAANGQYIGFREAQDINDDAQTYGSGVLYPGAQAPADSGGTLGFVEALPDADTFGSGTFID